MNPKIVIIDYGMGNLRNVQKGFEKVGFEAAVTRSKREIGNASAMVLPGVGAFRDCMQTWKIQVIEPLLQSIEGKTLSRNLSGHAGPLFRKRGIWISSWVERDQGKVVKFRPDP
jgi:hypothetical protein